MSEVTYLKPVKTIMRGYDDRPEVRYQTQRRLVQAQIPEMAELALE